MKKLYAICLIVFIAFAGNAQIVNIPDPALKSRLLNYSPVIDTNQDTQIQVSEALAVTALDLQYFQDPAFSDLTGLQAFVNLQYLGIEGNPVVAFNIGPFPQLKQLWVGSCGMSSLNLQMTPNLEVLTGVFNSFTTLDLSVCPNLKTVHLSTGALTSLNVTGLTHLEYLNCNSNHLTQLDVSTLVNLDDLQCQNNQLTVLDMTNLTKLNSLDCQFNLLTSLDASHTEEGQGYILFGGNPGLTNVNLKNGHYDYPTIVDATACPNLQYICIDEFERTTIENELAQAGIYNVAINSYCSFALGGDHNTITGNVRYDGDGDGCDSFDTTLPNIRLNVADNTQTGAAFTMTDGSYNVPVNTGNYTITPALQNNYFSVTPASVTVNFNAVNLSEIRNFCLAPVGVVYEPEITIVPIGVARPGFDAHYRIIYQNNGNQILHGSINLTFEDDILDFVSASVATSSQTANHLVWNFGNLLPFQTRAIDVTFNLNSPMEIPAVNNWDILSFEAVMQVNGIDSNPETDAFVLTQTVMGSMDPNDKTCLQGDTINPENIGDYLNYVIRFQNSGTFAAENVVVKDAIDTAKFDINSLQLTASSHPQMTRITGNKVEFIFANINLPAEQDDEPASHGFVAFKIKTKSNLTVGSIVSNKADIYFDYNFPITTNTATSVFQLLARDEFADTSIAVYPNPVKDLLTIAARENIQSIQLYDVMGRLIETNLQNSNSINFDFSQKAPGIYFVKINTPKGSKTEKIIKQ